MAYLPGKAQQGGAQAPESIAIPHSSFLQSATYDAANFSLTLEFKNGRQDVHRYVYPTVWQQFKEQQSHGSFYSRSIKGKYPTVNFRKPLKASDFKRVTKEPQRHAPKRNESI